MDIIEYWAKLTLDESVETDVNEGRHANRIGGEDNKFGQEGFGLTVPSELGRNINRIIMPLLLDQSEDEYSDIFNADLKVNTTYPTKLHQIIGGRKLPDEVNERGVILFMNFIKSKTTIEHVVEMLNDNCSDVLPFKLNKDNVIDCGSYKQVLSYRKNDNDEYDKQERELYVVNVQSNDVDKMDIDKDEFIKKFDEIRDDYQDGDVTISIGKKETFKQFFRKDPQEYGRLKDNTEYIMFFAFHDYLDEDKVKGIVRDITGKDMNVRKVGQIRRKYSKTQKFEDFDIFAVN